ncbi:7562_t:CDS:2, partial [Entrophospora sp. SA101]
NERSVRPYTEEVEIHEGIDKKSFNGRMYVMYYDADLKYYFVLETCQYRIVTTWGSVPESLVILKNVLRLKNDIIDVLSIVKEVKKVALQTNPKELFTIDERH